MRTAETSKTLIVTVQIEDRPDGGIRVTSEDVRGLLMSGGDRQHVWNLVGPTVAGLLRANEGLDVERVLYAAPSPESSGPQQVSLHAEFYVRLRQAA